MRSLLQRVMLAGALGLVAVLVSGCLSVDLTTTVTPAGRFTGELQLMLDKRQLQAFGAVSLDDLRGDLGDEQADNPRVQVTWSETDEQFVQTVSFTDATAQEIDAVTSSGPSPTSTGGGLSTGSSVSFPLTAEVRDSRMVVAMAQDAGDTGSGSGLDLSDPQARALLQTVFANARISVAITMPGDIENVTGLWPQNAGKDPAIVAEQPAPATYEISVPVLTAVELVEQQAAGGNALEITSAITDSGAASPAAPLAQSEDEGLPSSSNAVPILIGAGVVLLALIALGLLLARLRTRVREPKPTDGAPEAVTSAGAPPGMAATKPAQPESGPATGTSPPAPEPPPVPFPPQPSPPPPPPPPPAPQPPTDGSPSTDSEPRRPDGEPPTG